MKSLVRGIVALLAIGVCGVAAALLFVEAGVYDVTTMTPHTRLVAWATHQTYQQSIERGSANIKMPADLEIAANVEAGAHPYMQTCTTCHGATRYVTEPAAAGHLSGWPVPARGHRQKPAEPDVLDHQEWVEMTGMAAFGKEHDGSTDLEPRRIPAEGAWHFGCGL
jgi:cytochrome c553